MKITVLGSGGWGTALALLLLENGHEVTLWSYTEEESRVLRETRENPMLKGVPLPETMGLTTDMGAVKGCGAVVMATPSFAVRATAAKLKQLADPGTIVISVSKGIEKDTSLRLSQVIEEELQGHCPVVVLSGPSHAEEVGRHIPTGVVAAADDPKIAEQVQDLFMNQRFRVYTSTDKVGTDKYVREFWSMEDNTSEDITIDEKLSANGFYEVDSIDEDGVYTLKDYDKTASSIDEDSDGIVVEDLALDNTDQIYRNALSGSIDNVKFDDVSIANATIIDGRSNSDRNDSVYDREINSISRLEAALDAVRDEDLETKGTVEIDLYVKDGEITFICVTDVGGVAKDDGEQESGELDLTGVENFVCNSNIVTVDLVGTGKIPANYPVTVTLMKANSTEGDAEVGSKEHVNETAYEVNDWNNLGQIAIQESGNYYVIITIENEDGRVVDEFTPTLSASSTLPSRKANSFFQVTCCARKPPLLRAGAFPVSITSRPVVLNIVLQPRVLARGLEKGLSRS